MAGQANCLNCIQDYYTLHGLSVLRFLTEYRVIPSWKGFVFHIITSLFLTTSLAPVNISASAPGDFQLQVDWDRPEVLYPPYSLDVNTTFVDTWNITDVMSLDTCYLFFVKTFLISEKTFFSWLSLNWRVFPVKSSVSLLLAFFRTGKPSKLGNTLEVLEI